VTATACAERFLVRARGNRGGNALGGRTPFRPVRRAAFGAWEGGVRVVKIAVEVPGPVPGPGPTEGGGFTGEDGAMLSDEGGRVIGPE
jgi:hypothetical protein